MTRSWTIAAALALLFFALVPPRAALALSDEQEVLEEARITFQKLITHPEFRELPAYVKQARALVIFPNLFKAGFIVGGQGGNGVLVVRDKLLGWSDPAFYSMAAGSVGLQIGGQLSEVVFTIMSDKALDGLLANQFKFGGNISVAAGPMGKGLGADATSGVHADVYSFAKTAGLFGGVSFEGAAMLARDDWNRDYYGSGASPRAIVLDRRFTNPNARTLRSALSPY